MSTSTRKQSCAEIRKLRVVMLPWLAHGHVSPFLETAIQLSRRNFYIYFCSTQIILNSINHKITTNDSSNIELIELKLPSNPNLPPHLHTTKGLPPNLILTLIKSFQASAPTFSTILNDLHPPVDLVVYDILSQWVPPTASQLGIPAVFLAVSGATSSSFFLHQVITRSSTGHDHDQKFPFPGIFLRESYAGEGKLNRAAVSNNSLEYQEFVKAFGHFQSWFKLSSGMILVKSCRVIEERCIDYLSKLTGKRVVPLGPLQHADDDDHEEEEEDIKILQWLDKKKPFSTVLVSFGSEYYLGQEELEELAYGLELSNVNFIWVIRFPAGERRPSIEEAMPQGFLQRVGERGLVVDGWAPQVKILAHRNIGGFVSHCAWGSTLEGMYLGVPIIAMPMQHEHPIVARLVEEIGVGVEVLRDIGDGMFKRGEIAQAIKKVMVQDTAAAAAAGKELRRKAKKVGEKMREEGEEAPNAAADELTRMLLYMSDE